MVISAPSARGKDLPQQSLHDVASPRTYWPGMTLSPTGPTRGEEANEIEIGNFNTLYLSVHESEGAHSGLHVTGGNRNGYSLGAKCSCRQFGRSAKSDSSACGDGQEHDREDGGSGFIRPNWRPKTNTAGIHRCNHFPPVYLNAI